MAPTANGIQKSETPLSNNHLPTVFTKPDANMKLAQSPAPINSVNRLPSKKLNTNPHTIPSGIPLAKRNKNLIFSGTTAKPRSANSAIPISTKMANPRLLRPISETTFIPMNLERVYPITCAITMADLKDSPHISSIPSKLAAENGFRKAYIHE